jgi:hypothetical protein
MKTACGSVLWQTGVVQENAWKRVGMSKAYQETDGSNVNIGVGNPRDNKVTEFEVVRLQEGK